MHYWAIDTSASTSTIFMECKYLIFSIIGEITLLIQKLEGNLNEQKFLQIF